MATAQERITYSLEHEELLENICNDMLDSGVLSAKSTMRTRYIAACCAIGEPPLPTHEQVDHLNAAHQLIQDIRDSEHLTAEDFAIFVNAQDVRPECD